LWRKLQEAVPAKGKQRPRRRKSLDRTKMAKSGKPDFSCKLARPIEPTGGPGTLLETLGDAARFIGLMQPWRQARPYWDHCAGEILKAAESGKRPDILEATRCLEVALRKDNWLIR
jgi:hypothetical protein